MAVKIIGWGEATPPLGTHFTTNDEVLEILQSKGVDIKGKTGLDTEKLIGIRTRWWAPEGTESFDLAFASSQNACQKAIASTDGSFSVDQIGLIHSGGSTPDDLYPSCANRLQNALEVPDCEGCDISLACTSWAAGLILAEARMKVAKIKYGLVAVGETIGSRANASTSFNYCLWGDGGGAVVLENDFQENDQAGILYSRNISDGRHWDWARSEGIGCHPDHRKFAFVEATMRDRDGREHGADIHRYVIKDVSKKVLQFLDQHCIDTGYHPYLLPHNANLKMVIALGEKIGIKPDRILTCIPERGNTSSASIPITLAKYADQNKFHPGDHLLLVAFGGGMSVAIVLYQW